MDNAAWLFLALPDWYFSTLGNPMAAGVLSAIPAFGAICLGIGIALGLARRERRLLLFVIPAAMSQLLVAVAGALRGQVSDPAGRTILLAFLAAQLVLSGYLIYRAAGARLPASALALFSLTYALFAAFIAAMAFSDSWL